MVLLTRQLSQFIENMLEAAGSDQEARDLVQNSQEDFQEVLASFFFQPKSAITKINSQAIKICVTSPSIKQVLPDHVLLFDSEKQVDFDPNTTAIAVNSSPCHPLFQGLAGLDALYQARLKGPELLEDLEKIKVEQEGRRICAASFTHRILSNLLGHDLTETLGIIKQSKDMMETQVRAERLGDELGKIAPAKDLHETILRQDFLADLLINLMFIQSEPVKS